MNVQLIRNATLKITYAGRTFLVDPWLAGKGETGTFRSLGGVFRCEDGKWDIPMPMCDLPLPREDILQGVDACICTHVHPDHIDISPDGTIGAALDRNLPLFVQSTEDAHAFVRSGFQDVTVMYENSRFDDIFLVLVPARHGTKIPCGPAHGVILHHPDEPVLYLAGDTIWYDAVAETLRRWRPGVIVLNACAAFLLDEGRLIMDDADVEKVVRACDHADVIISHMDNVAHASISRADMKKRLAERGIAERVIMPDSTILTDYVLHRLCRLLEGLRIMPENMARNLECSFGLYFSQRVLTALIETGIPRQEAYVMVQRNAMKSWETRQPFPELIKADPEINSRLSEETFAGLFDPQFYLRHEGDILKRVFEE